jgi:hypothetical protein
MSVAAAGEHLIEVAHRQHRVVSSSGEHRVAPPSAADEIVSWSRLDAVAAPAGHDYVVAIGAVDLIGRVCAYDRCRLVGARWSASGTKRQVRSEEQRDHGQENGPAVRAPRDIDGKLALLPV